MKELKTKCDICKKEITMGCYVINMYNNLKKFLRIFYHSPKLEKELDICEDCMKGLMSILKQKLEIRNMGELLEEEKLKQELSRIKGEKEKLIEVIEHLETQRDKLWEKTTLP